MLTNYFRETSSWINILSDDMTGCTQINNCKSMLLYFFLLSTQIKRGQLRPEHSQTKIMKFILAC